MQIIELKSREVFGNEGRGIAALVEEPCLKISQIGLEPGKEIPVHEADAPATIQVVRGEGVFSVGKESARMGPGKLLRISEGAKMRIVNDTAAPLVFLVIKTPEPEKGPKETALSGQPGIFVNLVDFAPIKPGKEETFMEWFHRSSEIYTKHPGFISRTLLRPIERTNQYAAVVEHESKDTFMDMHLSDDREEIFHQVEPLLLGASKPNFYELLISYRKK